MHKKTTPNFFGVAKVQGGGAGKGTVRTEKGGDVSVLNQEWGLCAEKSSLSMQFYSCVRRIAQISRESADTGFHIINNLIH